MIKALIALVLLAVAAPAFAAQQVDLRPMVAAPNGVVTLGDLFDGAGPAARTVVAAGGPAGGNVILDAGQVQAVARRHGLMWSNPDGLSRLIARVDPAPAGFTAARRGGGSVLTYARNLAAGEVVQPEDVVWSDAPSSASADAPRDSSSVIGLAAKRALRAGAAVSQADVGAPRVVKKDDVIAVAYQAGGVKLVLQGKALADGGVGDEVNVLNTASKKIIQATVTGPGAAIVGPEADRLRAAIRANPKLLASLR